MNRMEGFLLSYLISYETIQDVTIYKNVSIFMYRCWIFDHAYVKHNTGSNKVKFRKAMLFLLTLKAKSNKILSRGNTKVGLG